MQGEIYFHSENTAFVPKQKSALRKWLNEAISKEGFSTGNLNYIFCSDGHLHSINQEYLDHDTLTDIITFDYVEGEIVSGDIFISIDRVRENARAFKEKVRNELHRVIIHGLLHLMGYGDKTPEQKAEMTEKEDFYLTLRDF